MTQRRQRMGGRFWLCSLSVIISTSSLHLIRYLQGLTATESSPRFGIFEHQSKKQDNIQTYQEYHRVHSSRSRCRVPWGGWRGHGVDPLCLPWWTASGRSCSACDLRGGWSPNPPVRDKTQSQKEIHYCLYERKPLLLYLMLIFGSLLAFFLFCF